MIPMRDFPEFRSLPSPASLAGSGSSKGGALSQSQNKVSCFTRLLLPFCDTPEYIGKQSSDCGVYFLFLIWCFFGAWFLELICLPPTQRLRRASLFLRFLRFISSPHRAPAPKYPVRRKRRSSQHAQVSSRSVRHSGYRKYLIIQAPQLFYQIH